MPKTGTVSLVDVPFDEMMKTLAPAWMAGTKPKKRAMSASRNARAKISV